MSTSAARHMSPKKRPCVALSSLQIYNRFVHDEYIVQGAAREGLHHLMHRQRESERERERETERERERERARVRARERGRQGLKFLNVVIIFRGKRLMERREGCLPITSSKKSD